jgi:hypothetical protein
VVCAHGAIMKRLILRIGEVPRDASETFHREKARVWRALIMAFDGTANVALTARARCRYKFDQDLIPLRSRDVEREGEGAVIDGESIL